ncbi:MAG: hypothetical protein U0X39_03005 [Bacteroidales bacterium]
MKERVETLAGKIISESFPLLHDKKIRFIVMRFKFYAMSFWIPPSLRIIIVSRRTSGFTDSVMTGILAHELCHQERYLKMGTGHYLLFAVRFLVSRKVQEAEEKATDRLTIEKGFGRQLYELTELSHKDRNHEDILSNYLSPEEIKSYSQSLGKW